MYYWIYIIFFFNLQLFFRSGKGGVFFATAVPDNWGGVRAGLCHLQRGIQVQTDRPLVDSLIDSQTDIGYLGRI